MPPSILKGAYARALTSSYAQIGVSLVIQVIMVPLYLHHLGQWRFGMLNLLLAVVHFVGFGLVWLSGSMQRALSEAFATGQEGLFRLVRRVSATIYLGYGILGAVGGMAALYGTEHAVPPEWRDDVWAAGIATALYFLVLSVLNVERAALAARGRQASANGLTVLAQAVYAVLAAPILLTGGGLGALMACFVAGAALALALAGWLRRTEPPASAPEQTFRTVLHRLAGRQGAAFLAYGTLAYFLQSDVLILGWLAGPEVVAAFVLVWRIAEWAAVALCRVPETLMPFIIHADARGERHETNRLYGRVLALTAALSGLVAVGYAVLGPWAVRLWVGPDYAPAEHWPFVLAGTAIFALSMARVPMVFGYALVRLRRISATMAVELAVRVGLTAVLLPLVGYAAPVAALCVAHALGAAWSYQMAGRALVRTVGEPVG